MPNENEHPRYTDRQPIRCQAREAVADFFLRGSQHRLHVERRVRQRRAQVVQHFTLFVQEYTVEGPDWHIEGEFLAHEFTAWDGERRALSIEKEWLTWGDCYTLDIPEPRDELLALAQGALRVLKGEEKAKEYRRPRPEDDN